MVKSLYNILDEDIENQSQDQKRIAHISKYKHTFVLCPTFINSKGELPQLDWHSFKFDENLNGIGLPNHQGVYAFSVTMHGDNLPINSYILYVGKAGDINSKNTIKKRYKDYVRELKNKTRPKIYRMLNDWYGHLSYHYAEVPNDQSTGVIEKQLTTIFIPPFNSNDYTGEMKDLLKGASIL